MTSIHGVFLWGTEKGILFSVTDKHHIHNLDQDTDRNHVEDNCAPSPSQLCRHWVSLLPHGIPPQNTWSFITISISYSVSVCLCVYAFSSLSVCMCLCSMPGLRMQSLWALSLVKQPPGQNSQRPKMQNEVKWNYFMNIHDIYIYYIFIYITF